ncbi:unnamed protein product [Adineta ricciae]|uniref:G-protein coupled receptors family 1 profile domain-containing protein n=1 Tax=Adineta ricciae TaxID=249248 RepID=A0A815WKR8_ADIRI|nr:unnamed protein product [Adineta ricciae]CAF1543178.1 unnamed protein product [Adineta ricciae]
MTSYLNLTAQQLAALLAIYDIDIPVSVRFWNYLILDVLSITCALVILYHLLSDRTLRQAPRNHFIIVLLCVGLIYQSTTVPFMLHFYRVGYSWKITPAFANFWTFIDNSSFTSVLIGFAWATIERHILIFHHSWMTTKRQRFFVHYLPFMLVLTYCYTYWFFIVFFAPCVSLFILSPMNGVPGTCTLTLKFWGTYDSIFNQLLPTFTIILASVALLIRVLWQKSRLNRSIHWGQQRKMTIQLLSISLLYFVFNLPRSIVRAMVLSGVSGYIFIKLNSHFIYFAIQLIFFFPFICCLATSELSKKFRKFLGNNSRHNTVLPLNEVKLSVNTRKV